MVSEKHSRDQVKAQQSRKRGKPRCRESCLPSCYSIFPQAFSTTIIAFQARHYAMPVHISIYHTPLKDESPLAAQFSGVDYSSPAVFFVFFKIYMESSPRTHTCVTNLTNLFQQLKLQHYLNCLS